MEVEQTFKTSRDNQPAVKIKVYQGESDLVSENEYIGEFIFTDIKKAKAGEVKVKITFTLDEESILHVKATDLSTGKEATTYFKTDTIVKKETYRSDLLLGNEKKPPKETEKETTIKPPEDNDTKDKNKPTEQKTVESRPESSKTEVVKEIKKPIEKKKGFWGKLKSFFSGK